MKIEKDMLDKIEEITITNYEVGEEITQYQFERIIEDLLYEIDSLKNTIKIMQENNENDYIEEYDY